MAREQQPCFARHLGHHRSAPDARIHSMPLTCGVYRPPSHRQRPATRGPASRRSRAGSGRYAITSQGALSDAGRTARNRRGGYPQGHGADLEADTKGTADVAPMRQAGRLHMARKNGAEGQEWDEARTVLVVMSDKFKARDWVQAEMGASK